MMETVKIATLVLDPANARKHSKKNLEAIKGSLARFGQQKPIVVSKDNVVIAGNGTLQAAKALNWSEISIVRSSLTGAEAVAYGIADNRTGELAEWDDEVLTQHLKALEIENFDLGSIGFDQKDLVSFGLLEAPPKPEAQNEDEFLIVVECRDEEEQQRVYEELKERGVKCKIMS